MGEVLGAVLAGGRSRRFGGDKAVALLDGQTLIGRAMAQLALVTDSVVVCGRYFEGATCLPDQPRVGLGPLGGLQAALLHATRNGFRGVLSTGCDMPLFPETLARELMQGDAAVTANHHLAGYWPATLAPALSGHLDHASDHSMRAWIAVVQPRLVAWPAGLPNINTGADLAALELRWPGQIGCEGGQAPAPSR
jgi:molybdopterin-guanine dinucleotide biosynthesis protein A